MIAAVLGATGYAGMELARLLAMHPEVGAARVRLASSHAEGASVAETEPHFAHIYENAHFLSADEAISATDVAISATDVAISAADVVFSALPAGAAEGFAAKTHARGAHFIDLSADFRFGDDEATYSAWYGKDFGDKKLHAASIYGLPEANRAEIIAAGRKGAAIIGNPGCYPTAATLGALPALAGGLWSGEGSIIVDAASGVTGAGREPGRLYHFPEMADSMTAYKIGSHRHTPEIARNYSRAAHKASGHKVAHKVAHEVSHFVHVIFTPHLAPMNRGILATLYIPLAEKWRGGLGAIHALYEDYYNEEKFVRVLPAAFAAATNRVRASNYCDISTHLSCDGDTLIVLAAIDNMVKGAAGQAIQNMNILAGFREDCGLAAPPALY